MPFKLKKIIGCPLNFSNKKSRNKCDVDSDSDDSDRLGANLNEDPDLILMRKTIEKNPEIFVLNNLMMCAQFFKNFDEEIKQIRQTLISSYEAQLNANLLPQKRALLPDVLQEHVGRNLKFTSARQTLRPTIEPLQPIRIYIVHENIEVAEENDLHYTNMSDIITYNLLLKPSDHEGYVYLEHLGSIPTKRSVNTEEELCSIAEKSDEVYDKYLYDEKEVPNARVERLSKSHSLGSLPEMLALTEEQKCPRKLFYNSMHEISLDSLYYKKSSHRVSNLRKQSSRHNPRKSKRIMTNDSPASSTSSGYVTTSGVDSDSDYNYSGTSSIGDLSKISELPNSCFKMVTYTQSGKVYDPREERKQNLTSKQKRIKEELRRYNYNIWYINSINFMRYFFKLFKQHLAQSLGFDEAAVTDAKCFGSVIYCDKIDVFGSTAYTKVEPYEIIPSVWSQWPDYAQEWLIRERAVWPDFEVVQKIKEFGCYIVPESYVPKQESNPSRKIEWQLTFPAAERYLETNMNHAQTKVLLVALMLHKTFVRPVDTLLGLTTSHIKNKLFWLIEQNASSSWPEHRTGECLLKLLSAIYQSISQNRPLMKDYFMKNKNLFQNIPNECLLQSQKQINRILTNPVMYLIYAMEHIHHKSSFFPRPDFDELLRILTLDVVSLVNPQLVYDNRKKLSEVDKTKQSTDYTTCSSFWNDGTTKNDYSGIPRKPVTNKTLINTKAAVRSPIIEISVRCAEMDDARICILLDFFIRHFIKIAQRYHQYGDSKQKDVYIAQAERLCILLLEKDSCEKNVEIYMQKISALKNLVIKVQPNKAPETPKRNTDQPYFSRPLKDRFMEDPEYEESVYQITPTAISENCASNYPSQAVDQQNRIVQMQVSIEQCESIETNVECLKHCRIQCNVCKENARV